jgi:peptidoglycan hydrolase CwlO-like protein
MIDLCEHRAYLAEEYDPDSDEPSELELVYRKLANEEAENMTLQAEVRQFKREIDRLKDLEAVYADLWAVQKENEQLEKEIASLKAEIERLKK